MLYIAENLAALEYKLQDEPMSVVQFLGNVINSCTHLASMLESGQVEGAPTDSIHDKRLVIPGVSGLEVLPGRCTPLTLPVGRGGACRSSGQCLLDRLPRLDSQEPSPIHLGSLGRVRLPNRDIGGT